jgi:hypothetical protein
MYTYITRLHGEGTTMKPELTLVNFLTEAQRGLPNTARNNVQTCIAKSLEYALQGFVLREGEPDLHKLKNAKEAALKVIETAICIQTSWVTTNVTVWERDHSAEQLHELWESAISLAAVHGGTEPLKDPPPPHRSTDLCQIPPQATPASELNGEKPAPDPARL